MKEHTKRIKILSKGVLPSKGFIYGPVLTPYNETVDTIFQLIAGGVDVVEVTDTGKEIPLTTSNFDEDHSSKAINAKEEAKKKAEADAQKKAQDEIAAKKKAEDDKRLKEVAEREAAKNKQNNKNNNNRNNQSHTSIIENTDVSDEVLEKK